MDLQILLQTAKELAKKIVLGDTTKSKVSTLVSQCGQVSGTDEQTASTTDDQWYQQNRIVVAFLHPAIGSELGHRPCLMHQLACEEGKHQSIYPQVGEARISVLYKFIIKYPTFFKIENNACRPPCFLVVFSLPLPSFLKVFFSSGKVTKNFSNIFLQRKQSL